MDINDLLTKGYFPEEIHPNFTTEDLANISALIVTQLNLLDPINGNARKKTSRLVHFSTPKIKGYRRNLGIPNPLHYIRLSHTISDHWADILTHCNRSSISLTKLKTRPDSQRAIVKPSFDYANRERIIRSTGYRYLLKLDITRCYHSIYTHSIPWALHTKPISKRNRKRNYFGNAIDEDCRKIQDGQTIGIPIGPDTSRIISEIILSGIDCEIKSTVSYTGTRVIDDYHLYFKTQGDLEIAKAKIQRVLRSYELELNQSKETVTTLPEIIESVWLNELRDIRFSNSWKKQRKDLIAFFDRVLLLAGQYPHDLVLTYAIAKIRATVFAPKNWSILQSYLLNSIIIESKILPLVAQMLLSYKNQGYSLNIQLIKEALEEIITFHSSLSNDFEVSWSLWTMKSLKITLSEHVAKIISDSENDIVILTALDLYSQNLIPVGLDLSFWETLAIKENLYTEHWLLAYEAKKKGWLSAKIDYLDNDNFFKILKDNNIEFYKLDKELDLSDVKVSSGEFYFSQKEHQEEEDIEDKPIVIATTTKPALIQHSSDDDEDLPF